MTSNTEVLNNSNTVDANQNQANSLTEVADVVSKDLVLEQLQTAASSEQRVKIFATIADKYGLEAVAGVLPAYGDAATAVLSTTYLLYEAEKLDLSFGARFKIALNSLIDFALGLVPFAGDLLDFFNKSNVRSSKYFSEMVDELEQKAREAGASEAEIEAIVKSKRVVTRQVDNVVNFISKS